MLADEDESSDVLWEMSCGRCPVRCGRYLASRAVAMEMQAREACIALAARSLGSCAARRMPEKEVGATRGACRGPSRRRRAAQAAAVQLSVSSEMSVIRVERRDGENTHILLSRTWPTAVTAV